MNNNHGGQRKGAGRPPTGRPRKVKTSITLAPDLLARAEATGNRSAYIEALIRREMMTQYKRYEYRDRTYILPAVEDGENGEVARVAVEWQLGDIQDGKPPIVVTRKNGQCVYVQWNVEREAYAPEFSQWHDPAVWQALTVR